MTGIVQQRIAAYEEMLRAKGDNFIVIEVPKVTVSVRKLVDFFEGTQHATLDTDHHRVEEELHLGNSSFDTAPTQCEEENKTDKFCDDSLAGTLIRTEEDTPPRRESLEACEGKSNSVANVSSDKSASSETASSQTEEESEPDPLFGDDLIETINRIEDRATCHDEIEPNDAMNKTLDAPSSELRGLGAPNPKPTGGKTTSRIRRMIAVGRKRFGRKKVAANSGHCKSKKYNKGNEHNAKQQPSQSKKTGRQGVLSKFLSRFRSCLPSSEEGDNLGKEDAPTSVEITVPIKTAGDGNQLGNEANLQIGLMVSSAVIKTRRDALPTHSIPVTSASNNSTRHTL